MTVRPLSCRPPYPQKFFWPRWFAQKVGRGVRANPWNISHFYRKPLILERNAPTGLGLFSTGLGLFSTGLPVFSTGAVFGSTISLSLYPIEKKEKRRLVKEENKQTLIHGFEQLPIFSSTGFTPLSTGFRGNPWKGFSIEFKELRHYLAPSTDTRKEMPVVSPEISCSR